MICNARRPLLTALLALSILVGVGCKQNNNAHHTGKPLIVATIHPLAQLTRQLVGDTATVVCLVPPGVTPHGYEITTDQRADVADADLLVSVGLGFDNWIHRAGPIEQSRVATFVFAHALDLDPPDHSTSDDSHDAHDHHHHGPVDPHLWLDPIHVRQSLPLLADVLTEAISDPDANLAIEQNLAQLQQSLTDFDADARRALAPYRGRHIVTFHPAFDRFCQRYGLAPAVTLKPVEGPSEITPARLHEVIQQMKRERITALFIEPQFSTDAARTIADETGAAVLELDPLGSPDHPDRKTYLQMMRYNLNTILDGLARSAQPPDPS